jgi:quinol monooxygenase YgiN
LRQLTGIHQQAVEYTIEPDYQLEGMMIVVIATMRAKAGSEQDLGRLLQSLIPETRKEKGCIQYDLHVAVEDPASYAFYERWVDKAALDQHLQTPQLSAALPRISQMAEVPPSIVVYQLIE